MKRPNTKLPTDETVKRDFETGTVQPGPGMAPEQPPAEDMKKPGTWEEFHKPGSTQKKDDQSHVAVKTETEDMERREAELAREAAQKGDTGRPGGGKGRKDVTGKVSDRFRVDPDITEGHASYQESGDSEIIPDDRLKK